MTLDRVKAARQQGGRGRGQGAGRPRPPASSISATILWRWIATEKLPAGRRDPQGAAGLHAHPFAGGPLQRRPPDATRVAIEAPHGRAGARPQAGREGARRAAALSLRAAPDRAVRLEARHLPRHLQVWDKKRAAIACMEGQEHLWDYYTNVAPRTGPTSSSAIPAARRAGGQPSMPRLPVGLSAHSGRALMAGSSSRPSSATPLAVSPVWPSAASPPSTRRRAARA